MLLCLIRIMMVLSVFLLRKLCIDIIAPISKTIPITVVNNTKKDHHQAHTEDCNLQELILRQQDNTHDDILPCANCLSLAYILYSLNEFYLEAPQFGERFRQKPYLVSYTPPFVGSIKSLRAPPVSYFLA